MSRYQDDIRKDSMLCSGDTTPDVFESEDQDLTVDNAFTTTHMLRLNKFNVVPYHSLVITRRFESQHAPLTLADWEATFKVMQVMSDAFSSHSIFQVKTKDCAYLSPR